MVCIKCGSEEVTVQGDEKNGDPLNFLVCTCRNCSAWWITPGNPQHWQIIRGEKNT